MASRYFGINRGQREVDVVEGSSTNSTGVELVIDLTKSLTREEVNQLVEFIKNYILKGLWPPA